MIIRRSKVMFIGYIWLLLLAVARLMMVGGDISRTAGVSQGSMSITMERRRGTIYDSQLKPLTNARTVHKAVLISTPQVVSEIYRCFERDQAAALIARLQSGKPVTTIVPKGFQAEGATVVECYERYAQNQPATHIIGYLDNEGQGVSGVEKAYDALLARDGSLKLTYAADARGGALLGVEPTLSSTLGDVIGGVQLTIDRDIQQVAENAAQNIPRGAVVVLEAATGKIRACVSRPEFSPDKVGEALNSKLSPLINRAFYAYNVGSVFKLCVVSAALESGISPTMTYRCTGSIDQSGILFYCHNRSGHGILDLSGALEQSCNTFFIQLAAKMGADALYTMVQQMGFGEKTIFFDNMTSAAGSLPVLSTLRAVPAELANFSFGQGSLMATPIQVAVMTATIANGGVVQKASLIEGTVDDTGAVLPATRTDRVRRVMSEQTAATVRQMMQRVISKGTGSKGAPSYLAAGGKTATAETGYTDEQGNSVNQAWFTGFYPTETPDYVITVLVENGQSGSASAAPVFKTIADGLYMLKYSRQTP